MESILATTSSFGSYNNQPIELLKSNDLDVVVNPFSRKLSELELRDLLDEIKPVGLLAGTEPIPRATLEMTSGHLKVISRVGVGWDNVDHDAAKELGIKVLRTEGVLDQAVAELTIGMILSALRNLARHDRDIRAGKWEKFTGSLLAGKKLGIIGYGSIGTTVSELASAFGSEVIFSDLCQKEVTPHARQVSFEELLADADIITVHVSGSNQILGAQELGLCKKGVILVNTSRGEAINEMDLVSALRSGQVGSACLDVFSTEPYHGDLVVLENTLLTPHIGSYALEARIRMEEMAVDNLLQALAG